MASVKPELPALKTPLTAPLSGYYPSELRSPAVGTPTFIKREDAMKTPISPPAAYLDFLSKLSPTVATPRSATGPSRFTFEKPHLTSSISSESITTTCSSATTSSFTSSASAASAASTASAASVASAASAASVASAASAAAGISDATAPAASNSRPPSPRSQTSSRSSSYSSTPKHPDIAPINIAKAQGPYTAGAIPPSPFSRPQLSARTPRRLLIPQSPYSPGPVRSPLSATSLYSPFGMAMSPDAEKSFNGPLSANPSRAVSIRQVVTRTVTYASRTPATPIVEPVPASKKRKIET